MTTNLAKAEVVLRRTRHAWLLVIPRCPFCGERHVHGGGPTNELPNLGLRESHCNRGQYELVEEAA